MKSKHKKIDELQFSDICWLIEMGEKSLIEKGGLILQMVQPSSEGGCQVGEEFVTVKREPCEGLLAASASSAITPLFMFGL